MAGDDSVASLYRILVDRCLSLETSHAKLREEFDELAQQDDKRIDEDAIVASDSGDSTSYTIVVTFPGHFSSGSPFRNVLDSIGHAIHVSSTASGKITFWNRSAEILFGWRSNEVLGQRYTALLIAEEYLAPLKIIMQNPFKRRSGEIFMALVTKNPIYEDGQLMGVVTVSSDAAIFNGINSENPGTHQDHSRPRRSKTENILWHPPRPLIASSVSNLASRFLLKKQNGFSNSCNKSREQENGAPSTEDKLDTPNTAEGEFNSNFHEWRNTTEGISSQKDENAFNLAQPSKIAAKVLAKLNIRGPSNHNECLQRKDATSRLATNGVTDEHNVSRGSFAVVHRAIWNGSDVAVKVYFAGEYKESTLIDCKKEIDIMRKLRHPNVLLFMGAVYSQERLAIVTEFLPRGSLFKALHKNIQALDVKRRMRMARDARGMNYLHHRNPPIVHRDLKSSNLLVDKNWNVKVGDFGHSSWKMELS